MREKQPRPQVAAAPLTNTHLYPVLPLNSFYPSGISQSQELPNKTILNSANLTMAEANQEAQMPKPLDVVPDATSVTSALYPTTDGQNMSVVMAPQILENRSCELCGATQTPMWRRGPSGKGTVCNACGVRWASRRRGSRKQIDESASLHAREHGYVDGESTNIDLEQYYCKYCGLTWPMNYFKNRQQFGAHCSNCSRKRKFRGM